MWSWWRDMEVKKLKECCTIIAGQSPESKYYNSNGDGLPFFQGKADFGELYPSIRVYCSQPTKIAEKDDILLSVRAPVGPTNLAPCKVCIGRGLTAIRPSEVLLTRYVLLFFRYFEAQLASKGTGTTFKAITQDVVKNLEIPIPPLPEQERIVSRIEELFSQLDAGVETLKKTKAQLSVYRQAVLKEAFSSELSCKTVEIREIVDDIRIGPFGTMLHKSDYISGGVPVINPQHIKSGKILPSASVTVSEEKARDLSAYRLQTNDIIMGRRGEMGRAAAITDVENGWLCGTGSILFRLKPNFDAGFYAQILSSPDVVHYLEEHATGTTMKNLNEDIVQYIPVPFVTAEMQRDITMKMDCKMSVCDSIEQTVDTALQQAEAMRQSILKDAFEGRL